MEAILAGLNEQQKIAVTYDPSTMLQVVAGPGTGKTKVLTARVAYLLLHERIDPRRLIVTTFTKKAANEMRERLWLLLKGSDINIDQLLMGTFHSVCMQILRKYGSLIDRGKPKIADDNDATSCLKIAIQKLPGDLLMEHLNSKNKNKVFLLSKSKRAGDDWKFDTSKCKREISRLKANLQYPEDYLGTKGHDNALYMVYKFYQEELANIGSMDFDDLLIDTVKLLKKVPVLNYVQHVLVDEFQDTNPVQIELMFLMCNRRALTVVGDPDQSIYSFRDAVANNFKEMACDQVVLDKNYRSTSNILDISENIMTQQKQRLEKNLKSNLDIKLPPVYRHFPSGPEEEARFVANELLYCKALPGLFRYSDMAILCRTTPQSRAIEKELIRNRIPYKFVRGHAFWDRAEVKSIMDLLRIVSSNEEKFCITRILGELIDGLGKTSVEKLETGLDQYPTPFDGIKAIVNTKTPFRIGSAAKARIDQFVSVIEKCRAMIEADPLSKEVLLNVFDVVYTESGLLKKYNVLTEDKEKEDQLAERRGNIAEVKQQLAQFEWQNDDMLMFEGEEFTQQLDDATLLEKFIVSVHLYTTTSQELTDSNSEGHVTISTIHGSKGLEWPVVFVPGLTENLMPAMFAQKHVKPENIPQVIEEERRIFYVSTTRAKYLLYISSFIDEQSVWQGYDKVSRFMTDKVKKATSQKQLLFTDKKKMLEFYQMMGVEVPPRDGDFSLDAFIRDYTQYTDFPATIMRWGGKYYEAAYCINLANNTKDTAIKREFSSAREKIKLEQDEGISRIIHKRKKPSFAPTAKAPPRVSIAQQVTVKQESSQAPVIKQEFQTTVPERASQTAPSYTPSQAASRPVTKRRFPPLHKNIKR